MTKEDAIKSLKALQHPNGDVEGQHAEADDILMRMLVELGYADVVSEYSKVPKWYA